MSPVLLELKQTLHDYLEAVPRANDPHPPDLLALFAKLDALQKQLDSSTPAELRHYMHGKSYRKAWNFLQAHSPQAG